MQSVRANGLPSVAIPMPSEIREQLDRIRSSQEFHTPDRGRRFLDYIVEEKLAGRGAYLKAYTIALEVFGRDASFDAQNDPVVRVEAGRIRRALERYYLVAGQFDKVIITIPKGGYVPCFRHACPETDPGPLAETADIPDPVVQTAAASKPADPLPLDESAVRSAPASWTFYVTPVFLCLTALIAVFAVPSLFSPLSRPSTSPTDQANFPQVVVEPFEDISEAGASAGIARGLTDEVIGRLAKFREIVVISNLPAASAGQPLSKAQQEPRFALQGRVRVEDSRLRLTARFVDRHDGSAIWANSYDRDLRVQDVFQVEADLAQDMATALASPYGIIFRSNTAMSRSDPDDWGDYACAQSYYRYRVDLNPKGLDAARTCLQQATKRVPGNSTYWALLSMTYLDELRFRYSLDKAPAPQSLKSALETARRAVYLDPQNARALQALMLANFFSGDVHAALSAGAAAYEINPNDTELAGEYGFRLALSGEWDTGCGLMSRTINKNPNPKGYFEVGLAMCAYMRGDYQAAELWVRMADLKYNTIHHLVLLAILGAEGRLDEAREEHAWLRANAPELLANIRNEISTRLPRPEDQQRVLADLKAAGVAIASP
ncbi:hypothetical protein EHI42_28340 [Rhizobium hidalgonense]|uniref:hypothetical protein n=1 Tax=Rhizobium hidalgonense TaxID=1538159 RepID=UPI000FEC7638|nr:hypothetical protein [Rhizobium hidalgonense]RWX08531.1 hypothetical protein EHI42_28340 [Rhizobium hidalgonense]